MLLEDIATAQQLRTGEWHLLKERCGVDPPALEIEQDKPSIDRADGFHVTCREFWRIMTPLRRKMHSSATTLGRTMAASTG